MRYSDWTVVSKPQLINGRTQLLCRCKCGTEKMVLENNLKRGVSRNCGCVRRKNVGAINRSHGAGAARGNGSRAASVWLDMHKRCRDARNKNYAGRGIKVCAEWSGVNGFRNFLRVMGEPPAGASIERRENSGGYSRSNCKWAYSLEQMNNTRSNVHGWLDGECLTAAQIARKIGKDRGVVARQIKKGKYGPNKT